MPLKLIKTKIIAAVALAFGLSIAVVVLALASSWERNVRDLSERSLAEALAGFATLEANDTQKLSAALEVALENDAYRTAFENRDLNALRSLTSPVFARLRERLGITLWYFIAKDATCVFRVHDPPLRGDPIRRETLQRAILGNGFGTGKELGKTAFALRVVHPYRNGRGELIGYMEFGEEIDHLLRALSHQTGADYALVVEKRALDAADYASARGARTLRNNWDDDPDTVLIGSTNAESDVSKLERPIGTVPNEGLAERIEKHGGRAIFRGVIPVFDADGKKVGAVTIARDLTAVYSAMQTARLRIVVGLAALMAVLGLALLWIAERVVFRRIEQVIETATRVVGGDIDSRIEQRRDDEVGRLEKLLERFRVVFVDTLRRARAVDKVAPGGPER